jgi:hypothetical protein
VEHAQETTSPNHSNRTYRRGQSLLFAQRSCFVLTPAAAEFLMETSGIGEPNGLTQPILPTVGRPPHEVTLELGPRWDAQRRELYLDGQLVKRFRLPSPNQELILTVFEEERWPVRIDDPLPCHAEQDPKRRLHDTIKSLNRNQKFPLLRFMGDGTGQGICWDRAARLARPA